MMVSNVLEALGFGFLVLAAGELGGRVAAFVTLGVILLFVGFVLDGVRVRIPTIRIPEKVLLALRKKPRKKKSGLTDEPLTNREMDLLEQAQE